jgi:drug/metabolite transporter (DMT)-like permease
VASILIHLLYFASLIESYRAGDMGQVYPIARGTAPLLTASASPLIVGEQVGPLAWAGILLLASGVILLSLRGGRDLAKVEARAVTYALLTSLTICAYSIVDGIGARLAGNANAYSVTLFVGTGPVMLIYALVRSGSGVVTSMSRYWKTGLAGGALQLGSYGTAIWAMTVAPIAIVATLRETSVLFGALLSVTLLKEPLRPSRVVAAVMILVGLVSIRLS